MYPLKLFQFLLHFLLLQLIYFDEREIPFKKILLPIYSSPFKNTRLTLTRNIHNEIHPRPTVSKLRQTPSKSNITTIKYHSSNQSISNKGTLEKCSFKIRTIFRERNIVITPPPRPIAPEIRIQGEGRGKGAAMEKGEKAGHVRN